MLVGLRSYLLLAKRKRQKAVLIMLESNPRKQKSVSSHGAIACQAWEEAFASNCQSIRVNVNIKKQGTRPNTVKDLGLLFRYLNKPVIIMSQILATIFRWTRSGETISGVYLGYNGGLPQESGPIIWIEKVLIYLLISRFKQSS